MKILYLIDNFDEDLKYRENYYALEMVKRGHEVYVLASNNRFKFLNEDDYGAKNFIWNGIQVIRLKPFFKIGDWMLWLRGYKKKILEINPDIIHTCEGLKISTSIMGVWAKRKGYKIIYDQERRTIGGKTLFAQLKYFLFGKYFEKRLAINSDLLRTVTDGGKEYLINQYGINKKKIKESTLGYDFKEFYSNEKLKNRFRKTNGFTSKDYIFGVSGKFNRGKKIETLVEAFIKSKLPLQNSYILIWGKFEKNYLEFLKEKYPMKNIHFKSHLMKSDKLNEFYNGIDCMIWTQQTISYFEALGAGTPIIIPYFNATSHIGKFISSGVFYYGKGFRLVDKYENIINETKRIRELTKIMRNKPIVKNINAKYFSWENICDVLEEDYGKIFNRKK